MTAEIKCEKETQRQGKEVKKRRNRCRDNG